MHAPAAVLGALAAILTSPVATSAAPLRAHIVQLRSAGPPLSEGAARRRERRAAFAASQDEALGRIRRALGDDAGLLEPRRSFRELVNGFSIAMTDAQADVVRRLDGVVRVEPDHAVSASLAESSARVGAPALRERLGVSGDGVVIAVLDTGIDYLHPDLGPGFGPGARVAGGYDFVNDDADPMDDHGHGTHVAAIAAGGGDVRGIAPGARLLAYKILDEHGSGLSSDVIVAVEAALDPDGDPLTDDGADVINLSLASRYGDADSPSSLALDAAVEAGAAVTVAAGNDHTYGAVGAPATARRALTVGALDAGDRIASFSSRGRFDGTTIKPDLAAPGTGICAAWSGPSTSPCAGAGRAEKQGTSMATPHVAGAVALLRELKPELSAPALMALLSASTAAVAADPLATGSGRLDVDRAAALPLYPVPRQLVLPAVDFCAPRYVATATLSLIAIDERDAGLATRLEPSGDPLPLEVRASSGFRSEPPARARRHHRRRDGGPEPALARPLRVHGQRRRDRRRPRAARPLPGAGGVARDRGAARGQLPARGPRWRHHGRDAPAGRRAREPRAAAGALRLRRPPP